MPKFNPPTEFDFSRPGEWPAWRERFNRYAIASKLGSEDGEIQVSTLLYVMGSQSETVFKSLVLSTAESKVLQTVLDKLDTYFMPQKNVIHERAIFNQRIQKPDEGVEAFIRSLYDLSAHCEFGTNQNEHIRDRLVVGLSDKQVSRDLQMVADLSLDDAVKTARQAERVKENLRSQMSDHEATATPGTTQDIHQTTRDRGYKRGRGRGYQPSSGRGHLNSSAHQDVQCKFCGRFHPPDRSQCSATHSKCYNCNKYGHYSRCCPVKAGRRIREATVPNDDMENYYDSYSGDIFLETVARRNTTERPWQITLNVCGQPVNFKIDSGADVCVLTEHTYSTLHNAAPLSPSTVRLNSVGSQLKCLGTFTTKVRHKRTLYVMKIYVVAGATCNLLSRAACKTMGLLRVNLNEATTIVDKSVFGDLGHMKCKPVKIRLRADAVPYSLNTARRIPIPLLDKVKEALQRMEQRGVIVKVTEATEWCAPMVPVAKKDDTVRICVDLKQLNRAVIRERYVLPVLDDILPKLSGAKIFSSLDCSSGFWAIPLEPESAKLTTFITPFGRYYFRVLPFGISSAPEIFQRVMTDLLAKHEGTVLFMDDILVYGDTEQQHDERLHQVLTTIKNAGLKLNQKKCVFRVQSLDFLGHHVSSNGISPSQEKLRAVMQMKPPANTTELKSVLGLLNYLCRYVQNLSTVLKPMSDLLRSDTTWCWGPKQDSAFNKAKELVASSPTLAYFDPRKPTVVSADASSYGLGACLLQQYGPDLRPVAFASRTLTESEKHYAQIEKECLASVWACEKFSQYVTGLPTFRLLTDHKPLVPLIMSKDINNVPVRCQRLLMRLMRFNPEAEYVPGTNLIIADALSRRPMEHTPHDIDAADDITAYVEAVQLRSFSATRLQDVKEATDRDEELQAVMDYIVSGWPEYVRDLPTYLHKYYEIRHHLSVSERLLLYDDRIYIPKSLQKYILERIHDGHQGINKCLERARSSVYWLGITAQVQSTVESCNHCQKYRNTQQKEPLISTPLPTRPWERIAADLCDYGNDTYLIVVDYYSRYIEMTKLFRTTSVNVIQAMMEFFARWGVPETLMSDNGPQFSSQEFAQFSQCLGFNHITSSPHYPQSNGEVERAVQTAKSILRQDDPLLALMIYRSTPIAATKFSPSQLLMGRAIRTTLPTLEKNLLPDWPQSTAVKVNDDAAKSRQQYYYNRQHSTRPLSTLQPGDRVLVRTDHDKAWNTNATVVHDAGTPRSWVVRTDQGSVLRRNRRHLQSAPPSPTAVQSPSSADRHVHVDRPAHASPVHPNTPATPRQSGRPPDQPRRAMQQTDVPPTPSRQMSRFGRSYKAPQKLNL